VSWGGSAFDPSSGYYIVNLTNLASPAQLKEQASGAWGLAYGYRTFRDLKTHLPCQRPPWGELVAVNVNTGEIAWRKTLGVTDTLPEGLRETGRPNAGGPITTASGLTFIGATDDNRMRAFDSATGELLWEAKLPASVYATPMTYQSKSGKQFVVAVDTGGVTGSEIANDEVTAFALPVMGAVDAEPPPGAGLDLINERCVSCHPATQIFSAPRKTPLEWSQTVKRMAARGAELSPEEAKTISDYLAENFAAR
jgi:hypothetical protein